MSQMHLIVEGNDDFHAIVHLLQSHGIGQDQVHTDQAKGKDNILAQAAIAAFLEETRRKTLGFVLDADEAADRKWEGLCAIFTNLGLEPPPVLPPTGAIFKGLIKSVGVWIMPDNRQPGGLEHFLARLIPEKDPNWPHAREAVRTIPERRFPNQHAMKAEVHTWLAWQENPGRPYGVAIRAKDFDPASDSAQSFIQWVEALLG